MNEYATTAQRVQKALDQDAAFIQADPCLAQRVLRKVQLEGQTTAHVRIRAVLILAVAFTLLGAAAFAATFAYRHIETAMDITKDKGAFADWALDDKLALLEALRQEGISLPQEGLATLADATATEAEKERIATEMLVAIYGSEQHISHFTMASHDWGDPFYWTLEQKVWFWETLREKGLYNGRIRYLMPEEKDMTREQAALLARQAIQEAYHLTDETMAGYDADVSFFTTMDDEATPRWLVYLGHGGAEAADYSVLLTRDGQVTEDESLHVYKPQRLEKQPVQTADKMVETPLEKRMKAADVLYLAEKTGLYHLLPDCPSSKEALRPERTGSIHLQAYQPCLYCVLSSELWSAEDKILYGVMHGVLPDESAISTDCALQAARDYLQRCGVADIDTLAPCPRYYKTDLRHCYVIFFGRLSNGKIDLVYSVTVHAQSGEVLSMKALSDGQNG